MMERPYRLSARFIATIDQPGRYGDGRGSGGLSVLVKHTAHGHLAKSWAQRISVDGRQRNLGLGSWPHVSLAEAREKCALNLAARRRGELVTGRKRAVPTFEEAVEKVIAVHRAGWKDGGRQEKLWRASLRDHAMPKLGGRPVNRINTSDVMAVLLPIWNEKRVTARRVRQRIGAVMRWAVAQGYREDNPAGEAIGAALPKNGFRPQQHRALPYAEVGDAIEQVRGSGAYPATVLAFEFLVLTACRSGEVRGALWNEIDLESGEWRIPAERMKTHREHRVPLSGRAGGAPGGAETRGRLGSGLLLGAGPPTVRGGDLEDGPGSRDRCGASRVPFELPGLGGGVHGRAARGVRAGAGACEHEQHRGGLPAHRPVRAEASAHGAVGRVPRQDGGQDRAPLRTASVVAGRHSSTRYSVCSCSRGTRNDPKVSRAASLRHRPPARDLRAAKPTAA